MKEEEGTKKFQRRRIETVIIRKNKSKRKKLVQFIIIFFETLFSFSVDISVLSNSVGSCILSTKRNRNTEISKNFETKKIKNCEIKPKKKNKLQKRSKKYRCYLCNLYHGVCACISEWVDRLLVSPSDSHKYKTYKSTRKSESLRAPQNKQNDTPKLSVFNIINKRPISAAFALKLTPIAFANNRCDWIVYAKSTQIQLHAYYVRCALCSSALFPWLVCFFISLARLCVCVCVIGSIERNEKCPKYFFLFVFWVTQIKLHSTNFMHR